LVWGYSLTSKLRIIDLVHFDNWRNPGLSDLQSAQFSPLNHKWQARLVFNCRRLSFALRARRAVVRKYLPTTGRYKSHQT